MKKEFETPNILPCSDTQESPTLHAAILSDREAALRAGQITVSDWEGAKERIKKTSHEV
jgi:hypothetical protein